MTMLDHDLAERGDRLVAQFIDSFVTIVIIIFSAFLSSFSEAIGGIIALFGLLFAIFYILCADGLKDGQSYGKQAEVLKDRLSNEKKGTECSILSPVKQKMMSNDSLVSQACQIGLDAALSTRLPRVELTLIL